MPSVLSRVGAPFAGLAVGVSIGAAIVTLGQPAAKFTEVVDRVKTLEAERDLAAKERDAMKATNEEAQLQLDALRAKHGSAERERDAMKAKVEEGSIQLDALKVKQGSAERERDAMKAKAEDASLQLVELTVKQGSVEQEAQRSAKEVKELKKARDEMDALRMESVRRAEALEFKNSALLTERTSLEQKHLAEITALKRSLSDVCMDLEGAKAEQGTTREKLKKAADTEIQVKTLAAGLDVSQRKVQALEEELRQEVVQGAKATVELSGMQTQVQIMLAERQDASVMLEEAQSRVMFLEEQQSTLQGKLAASQRNRKDSLSNITRSLSGISDKLDKAETSWSPWNRINEAKKEMGIIHQQASEEDLLRGA